MEILHELVEHIVDIHLQVTKALQLRPYWISIHKHVLTNGYCQLGTCWNRDNLGNNVTTDQSDHASQSQLVQQRWLVCQITGRYKGRHRATYRIEDSLGGTWNLIQKLKYCAATIEDSVVCQPPNGAAEGVHGVDEITCARTAIVAVVAANVSLRIVPTELRITRR